MFCVIHSVQFTTLCSFSSQQKVDYFSKQKLNAIAKEHTIIVSHVAYAFNEVIEHQAPNNSPWNELDLYSPTSSSGQ